MKRFVFFGLLFTSLLALSCTSDKSNQLTPEEQSDGWQLLFDGKTTSGWHIYNQPPGPSAWEVKDGELVLNRESKATHGDLVSDAQFDNFDLTFDWKMPSSGNSGVMINVIEKPALQYAWLSGPEYQLLDKDHPKFGNVKERSGCLYGFAPQKNPVENKPAGEWNNARITQQNGKIAFYLNGLLTGEEDFTSEEWKQKIAGTHFAQFPEFGKSTKGHIVLQEWSKGVSFKNIKIRPL
jgi:hypothetical protein